MPLFRYFDVSGDPSAAERSRLAEESRTALDELGFVRAGHALAEAEDFSLTSEVWLSADGRTTAELTHAFRRDVVNFKSLLDDGHIVSTEPPPPGLWGKLIAHGVRTPDGSGYEWVASSAGDIAGVLADHQRALARRIEQSGAGVLVATDLAPYFAMRLRYREIADPGKEIQERVAARTWRWAAVLAVVAIGCAIAAGSRIGTLGVALLLVLAALLFFCAYPFGYLVLGPIESRRRVVDRTPLEEMLARGQAVPRRALPEPEAPVFLPAATALEPARQRQLERRDKALFMLDAAGAALAVAGLGAIFGMAGVVLGIGLEYLSRGAIAVATRRPRLIVLRDKLVGDLVAIEPVASGAACAMTSPPMAWIQLLAGVVLLVFGARMRQAGESQDLSPTAVLVIAGYALLLAAIAARNAGRRHRATREARAQITPP